MNPKKFFSYEQQEQLIQAIRNAEMNTSGEIRIHLEERSGEDPYKSAVKVFEKLNMHKTAQRNGVLFYLSTSDQKLSIIGDKGINEKVPAGFWDDIFQQMIRHFQQEQLLEGLIIGVSMAGEQLAIYFPFENNDKNELSDELSF